MRSVRALITGLLLLMLLTVGAGQTLAQAVVLCIGDSITDGIYVAVPYPTRLRNMIGQQIISAGVGGERAFQGLARIDALLAEHNPSHVLILFGTNDILNHRQNLRDTATAVINIARRARARGAVAIVGTAPPMTAPRTFNAGRVNELNSYIRSFAAANGFVVADIQAAFGSGAGLMISDGFHPNDSGMQVIARTFAPRISIPSVPLPGRPTVVQPKGLVPFAPRPTFSWTASAHATSHVVTLLQNGQPYHTVTVTGTSWTPTWDLPCAAYSWNVAGRNSRGNGPASATEAIYFRDSNCCIPIRVENLRTELQADGWVDYVWDADDCANEYRVWIERNGTDWSTDWHAWEGGSPARLSLPGHTVGAYRWWVLAKGPDGTGRWSAESTFNYGVPLPVAPTGRLSDAPVQLVWDDRTSSVSDRYRIWLSHEGQGFWTPWVEKSATFPLEGGRRAAVLPTSLSYPYGTYTWWIQGETAGIGGRWSSGLSFVIGQPVALAYHEDGAGQAHLTWEDASTLDATWYEVVITRDGVLYWQRWVPVQDTLVLPGHQRSVQLAITPGYGEYQWWVRAWKPGGTGPWSESAGFLKGIAFPVAPTGTVGQGTRVFSWNTDGSVDATWFRIWINRGGSRHWDGWLRREDTTSDGALLSYALPQGVALPSGSYTWWILPWNPTGSGVWSDAMPFIISP